MTPEEFNVLYPQVFGWITRILSNHKSDAVPTLQRDLRVCLFTSAVSFFGLQNLWQSIACRFRHFRRLGWTDSWRLYSYLLLRPKHNSTAQPTRSSG
jgi:hypothetical protein